jgi:peroxiredoxin
VDARRRGARFLLLCAALVATGSGAWVAFSGARGGPLRSGAPAPAFELPALTGGNQDLARYRGRVLFVNFWATWCAPCREEAPALQALYGRMRGEGFEVLAISIDDAGAVEKVQTFVQQLALDFPILLDPEQRVYRAYQAYGVPETFLIDKQGRVVERFIGPKNWGDARYERAIRQLLQLEPATLPASEVRGG